MSRSRQTWRPYVALTSSDLHDQLYGRPRRRRLRIPTPAPLDPAETWQAAIWGAVSALPALLILLGALWALLRGWGP